MVYGFSYWQAEGEGAKEGEASGRRVRAPKLLCSTTQMSKSKSTWVTQLEAASYLQVSSRTLIRWRSDNLLRPQIHYRRATPSPRSKVLYNLEKCEKLIIRATSRDPKTLEAELVSSNQ